MTTQNNDEEMISSKHRIGEHVYARWLKPNNKRWELAIIVDEETTAEQLRAVWPKIATLREALKSIHGTDLSNPVTLLRVSKSDMIVSGMSYAEVAWETNYEALLNLCRAFLDLERGDTKSALQSMIAAGAHFLALRMKREEVGKWIWFGLAEIKEGRAPWTVTHGPIDKERVRANCRQLSREQQSEKVVIKELPKIEMVAEEDFAHFPPNEDPRTLANHLLSKEAGDGGLQKLTDAIERHRAKQRTRGVENSG